MIYCSIVTGDYVLLPNVYLSFSPTIMFDIFDIFNAIIINLVILRDHLKLFLILKFYQGFTLACVNILYVQYVPQSYYVHDR